MLLVNCLPELSLFAVLHAGFDSGELGLRMFFVYFMSSISKKKIQHRGHFFLDCFGNACSRHIDYVERVHVVRNSWPSCIIAWSCRYKQSFMRVRLRRVRRSPCRERWVRTFRYQCLTKAGVLVSARLVINWLMIDETFACYISLKPSSDRLSPWHSQSENE